MAASPGDADAGGGGAAPLPDIPPYAERLKTVLQFVTGPSHAIAFSRGTYGSNASGPAGR